MPPRQVTEADLRQEIVEVCHALRRAALVVALEGNISCRLCRPGGGDLVLASPTMRDKGKLAPGDLALTDLEGKTPHGGPTPSSELPMHLAIYKARPDVCGIVHAHPPYATSFAVAAIPLGEPLLAEAVVDLGEVPIAPYQLPGREELASAVASHAAAGRNVILMANHGAVALGANVTEAHHRMETLEHYAQIALFTRILGRSVPLTSSQVADLVKASASRPVAPGCPVCAHEAPASPAASTAAARTPVAVPTDGEGRYVLTHDQLVGLITEAIASLGGR